MPPNQPTPYQGPPQKNAQGGYDVVPPLPGMPNPSHSGHNPYEFIVSPAAPRKTSLLGGASPLKGLVFLLAIVVVVIVGGVLAVSLLAPKGSTAGLTAIAQREQEIIRVASAATDQAQTQDTKNFVQNVASAVTSSQQQVESYLTAHGTKLSDKVLALDQSAATDSLLTNAQASNTYDTAVVSTLLSQLKTCQSLLQTTYNATSNTQLKQTLRQDYTSAALLTQQGQAVGNTPGGS